MLLLYSIWAAIAQTNFFFISSQLRWPSPWCYWWWRLCDITCHGLSPLSTGFSFICALSSHCTCMWIHVHISMYLYYICSSFEVYTFYWYNQNNTHWQSKYLIPCSIENAYICIIYAITHHWFQLEVYCTNCTELYLNFVPSVDSTLHT